MPGRFLSALLLASSLVACAPTSAQRSPEWPAKSHQPAPGDAKLDRAAIRAELAARREVVVQRFLEYREGRVYPMNDRSGFEHVWIDASGNLCAAATLVSKDWGRDSAVLAAGGNNNVALADLRDGALADWILLSGLTHHEIVSIQVPGFAGGGGMDDLRPVPVPEPEPLPRAIEVERLYGIYIDVERQLRGMWELSLDEATDALLARPDLARELLAGDITASAPVPSQPMAFAQPPPARRN
jgi:hypothetical protein